jgi:hypothetical protein
VKPSALKREHPALQKMKFINLFLFLWVTGPSIQGTLESGSESTTLLETDESVPFVTT